MARDPLNEDGRRYGIDGTVDLECLKMGWNESFTQGLTVCAEEYRDWGMVDVGGFQDSADSMAAASCS